MKRYEVSGFGVMEYEEVASTNSLAEKLPLSELKDKQVILTWRQTQGRGQATNRWESAPGKNISMTVIFRPECLEAGKQFAVSMVIALGCLDFLSHYVEGVTVKWPNDVYVGERKISGILIEHRVAGAHIQSSLCGIGVNINQEQFLSDAPNPVSLFQLLGRELPLQEVLEELLECIGKRYEQIHRYAELENDFLRHMYRSTGIYDFEDERGIFRASVGGIDEYGQLILKDTVCKSDVIKAGDWAKITAQSKEAVDTMLGLHLIHVGINTGNEEEAAKIAGLISTMLNMKVTPGNSSIFVGNKEFEIMKKPGRGTNGHIAIGCNNVDRAIYHLSQRGVKFDLDSKNVKNGKTVACYMEGEIAGFAFHLVQA